MALIASIWSTMVSQRRSQGVRSADGANVAGARPPLGIGIGLGLAGVGLLSIWLVHGRANRTYRTAAWCGGCLAFAWAAVWSELPASALVRRETIQREAWLWVGWQMSGALMLSVPFAVDRICRLTTARRAQFQTSIAGLLSLTTAVALLLGVGLHARFPLPLENRLLPLSLSTSILPWVAFATWRAGRRWHIGLIAYLAGILATAGCYAVAAAPGNFADHLRVATASGLVFATAFALLRATERHDSAGPTNSVADLLLRRRALMRT